MASGDTSPVQYGAVGIGLSGGIIEYRKLVVLGRRTTRALLRCAPFLPWADRPFTTGPRGHRGDLQRMSRIWQRMGSPHPKRILRFRCDIESMQTASPPPHSQVVLKRAEFFRLFEALRVRGYRVVGPTVRDE